MGVDVLISGVGQSAIGRRLHRSGLSLTLDAVLAAVADAGLELKDIDGVSTHPGRLNAALEPFSPVGAEDLVQALNLKCNWYNGAMEGPSQLTALFSAYGAIKSGLCRHVVLFRTLTEGSSTPWYTYDQGGARTRIGGFQQWMVPFDSTTAINWFAMWAQRHFHVYGTRREQLGWIPVNGRRNAMRNPKAVFQTPLSIEDYLDAKLISSPFCLFDCDPLSDCSTAIVMSSSEARADLKSEPVRIEAMGTSVHAPCYWDQMDMPHMAAHDSAKAMWGRTDLKPKDVDVALLYDGFSILALTWLEALGFCGLGEGGPFVEGGERIALNGELPLNPHGGQLSEGRAHGFGFVHEAVIQLRGRGGVRQVEDAEVAVVSNGGGPMGGCMLLTKA